MTPKGLARYAALAGVAMLLGGCYTVALSPYSSMGSAGVAPAPEDQGIAEGPYGDQMSPRVGRFYRGDGLDRDGDGYYDYSGLGYGYPAYDRYYGLYGYGTPFYPSYGYGGYYTGYTPYGYGYDPYYYGTRSAYVPLGYALVTTSELAQLRQDSRMLESGQTGDPSQASIERQRRQAARRAEQAWTRRVDTRERKAPQATVRSTPSVTSSSSSTSTTKPAATQSSGAKSAKDRKKRR